MGQLVLLQLFQMISNQLCRQPVGLTACFQLRQEALAHVARAATNRLEPHHNRAGSLNQVFRPATLRRDLFVGGVEPSVRIEITNDGLGGIAQIAFRAIHVELPFEVFSQRRRPGQELFKSRSVFLVFEFLRLITGIEVILELATKVDLFKRITRVLGSKFLAGFYAGPLGIGVGGKLRFRLRQKRRFDFALARAVRGRPSRTRRGRFNRRGFKVFELPAAGHVIQNLFGQFARLFLGRNLFEHRIFSKLLLDQVGKLERGHLQHLDTLPELWRKYETLRKTGSESD